MSMIPAFEIGIRNAWLFMCVFPLQWLIVSLINPAASRRTRSPRKANPRHTVSAMSVLWAAMSIYSIFLPLHIGTAWFYTGLGFFIAGLAVLITATRNFTTAPADRPITGGAFRYSRHPMYLSMFLVYIGVSITAASWVFVLLTIISIPLQRRQAILEEELCRKRYGDAYRDYMRRTPRWLGIAKSG